MSKDVLVVGNKERNNVVAGLVEIGAIKAIRPDPESEFGKRSKELQEKYKDVGVVLQFEITDVGENILKNLVLQRTVQDHGKEILDKDPAVRIEAMVKTISLIKKELGGNPHKIEILIGLCVESCEEAGIFEDKSPLKGNA